MLVLFILAVQLWEYVKKIFTDTYPDNPEYMPERHYDRENMGL